MDKNAPHPMHGFAVSALRAGYARSVCVQDDGANVTLVRAGFNTIFKVVNPASTTTATDADAALVPIPGAAFMVRVAASAWGYTLQQLASEPMWLRALRADTDVKVLHTARMHSARFVIAHS